MKPRISVLAIGVADLERSLEFYRDGLGLPTEGIIGREFEHGAIAFFTLSGGLKLAIWAQDDVAYDTGQPKTAVSSTSFIIGHNVVQREEVDQVMDEAAHAGAEIIKSAHDTFYGGYAGYFQIRTVTYGKLSGIPPTFRLIASDREFDGGLAPDVLSESMHRRLTD